MAFVSDDDLVYVRWRPMNPLAQSAGLIHHKQIELNPPGFRNWSDHKGLIMKTGLSCWIAGPALSSSNMEGSPCARSRVDDAQRPIPRRTARTVIGMRRDDLLLSQSNSGLAELAKQRNDIVVLSPSKERSSGQWR